MLTYSLRFVVRLHYRQHPPTRTSVVQRLRWRFYSEMHFYKLLFHYDCSLLLFITTYYLLSISHICIFLFLHFPRNMEVMFIVTGSDLCTSSLCRPLCTTLESYQPFSHLAANITQTDRWINNHTCTWPRTTSNSGLTPPLARVHQNATLLPLQKKEGEKKRKNDRKRGWEPTRGGQWQMVWKKQHRQPSEGKTRVILTNN